MPFLHGLGPRHCDLHTHVAKNAYQGVMLSNDTIESLRAQMLCLEAETKDHIHYWGTIKGKNGCYHVVYGPDNGNNNANPTQPFRYMNKQFYYLHKERVQGSRVGVDEYPAGQFNGPITCTLEQSNGVLPESDPHPFVSHRDCGENMSFQLEGDDSKADLLKLCWRILCVDERTHIAPKGSLHRGYDMSVEPCTYFKGLNHDQLQDPKWYMYVATPPDTKSYLRSFVRNQMQGQPLAHAGFRGRPFQPGLRKGQEQWLCKNQSNFWNAYGISPLEFAQSNFKCQRLGYDTACNRASVFSRRTEPKSANELPPNGFMRRFWRREFENIANHDGVISKQDLIDLHYKEDAFADPKRFEVNDDGEVVVKNNPKQDELIKEAVDDAYTMLNKDGVEGVNFEEYSKWKVSERAHLGHYGKKE